MERFIAAKDIAPSRQRLARRGPDQQSVLDAVHPDRVAVLDLPGQDLLGEPVADGGAVPGDRIVGILTPGQGITIYPIFARSLQNFDDEPDRWIDLTWDTLDDGQFYPARIKVMIHNEVGALAQVTGVIGANGGNIDNLQMVTRAQDFYDLEIVLEVHDVKHLNRIMQDLRMKPLVSSVVRMTG